MDYHLSSDYTTMLTCGCILCKNVQTEVAANKKAATKTSVKLSIAMIKLAIFIEVSFYMRDTINKEKKLEIIFNNIIKADDSLHQLNIIFKDWTLENVVKHFSIEAQIDSPVLQV
jgi:predicted protein tyrosine phosphatase